jgi:hypothetical protein
VDGVRTHNEGALCLVTPALLEGRQERVRATGQVVTGPAGNDSGGC